MKTLDQVLAPQNNSYNALRYLLALSVIISHAFSGFSANVLDEPLTRLTGWSLGGHAVHAFFVLSGVFIAASLDRSTDMRQFFAARIARIYPGAFVCFAVSALVLGAAATSLPLFDYLTDGQTWRYVGVTLATFSGNQPLPGVFENLGNAGEINIPVWTLKYELMCYAALGLIGLLGWFKHQRLFWLSMSAIFFAAMASEILRQPDVHTAGMIDHITRLFLCFFFGVVAYKLRAHFILHAVPAILLFALAIMCMGHSWCGNLFTYLATGYFALFLGGLDWGKFGRFFQHRDYSYGTYIYGWPIMQMVLTFSLINDPLTLALATACLATAAAQLSWMWVEKPANKALKNAAANYLARTELRAKHVSS